MKNNIYNYIIGSLIGLIEREYREDISTQIQDQTSELKSIYDIEKVCKGILVRNTNIEMERQVVRVSKEIARFIIDNNIVNKNGR